MNDPDADFSDLFDLDPGDEGELLGGLPHCLALGMRLMGRMPGAAVLMVPYDERLVGDPATGVIHGGVVTTLLDTCCGTAVMASPSKPLSTATLDLRVDYMRPARPQRPIHAFAHCYRSTRNIAFVRAVAYDEHRSDPVASAAGAFMIEGARGGEAADGGN